MELSFWWRADTEIEQLGDVLEVIVGRDPEQFDHLRELPAVDPRWFWRAESLDLSAYAGHEVTVIFAARTDGEAPTTFRLDDVSLFVCIPPTPPQPLCIPLVLKR